MRSSLLHGRTCTQIHRKQARGLSLNTAGQKRQGCRHLTHEKRMQELLGEGIVLINSAGKDMKRYQNSINTTKGERGKKKGRMVHDHGIEEKTRSQLMRRSRPETVCS